MKKPTTWVFPVLAASLASAVPAFAAQFDIDPAHSNIGFEVKHLSVSTVRGNFPEFSGNIDLNDKDFTHSKAEIIVKAASVTTSNVKRDTHLRSADFFDVEKFPEAKFVSTNIKKTGNGHYVAEGDFTIHGVTKHEKINLDYLGTVKDPMGSVKAVFSANTELNRRDFGINYGPAALISDKIKLTIDVEAAPHAAPQAKVQ